MPAINKYRYQDLGILSELRLLYNLYLLITTQLFMQACRLAATR